MRYRFSCCLLIVGSILASAGEDKDVPGPLDGPRAKIMVLGMFHFHNPGLDSYKPKYKVDILSQKRQKELEAVLAALERYAPTRIAIEVDRKHDTAINKKYAEYLARSLALGESEVYQVGFKLAKRLGHKKLYAVDAPRRHYLSNEEYEKKNAGTQKAYESFLAVNPGAAQWLFLIEGYEKFYSLRDAHQAGHTLGEHLLLINSASFQKASHGIYVMGWGISHEGLEYGNADSISSWYNRNLRIVENIQRITSSPDERILLIIGSGHVPIIYHALDTSPQYDVIDFATYFGHHQDPQHLEKKTNQ